MDQQSSGPRRLATPARSDFAPPKVSSPGVIAHDGRTDDTALVSPLDLRGGARRDAGNARSAASRLRAVMPLLVPLSAAQRDRQLVLAAPGGAVDLSPAERLRLDRRAVRLVEKAEGVGAPITYVGVGKVLERPRLYPGTPTDWVLMRLEDDPLYQQGRFPIPREQRQHLSRLATGGVEMDELLVAHEVPEAAVCRAAPGLARTGPQEISTELLATLVEHPGPADSTRRFTARAGKVAEGTGKIAKGAARGAGQVLKGAAIAGGVVAASPLLLAAALLDPVVFGVRRVPGRRDLAQIFELVRWDW